MVVVAKMCRVCWLAVVVADLCMWYVCCTGKGCKVVKNGKMYGFGVEGLPLCLAARGFLLVYPLYFNILLYCIFWCVCVCDIKKKG